MISFCVFIYRQSASSAAISPTAATAVAAEGIEPELQQVAEQLDSVLASLDGLLKDGPPLLQDASSGQPGATVRTSAPAGETGGSDLPGPYTARNLSRGEYSVVRLMQAVRRLGRDVRSLVK